jgi:hypothetical protein
MQVKMKAKTAAARAFCVLAPVIAATFVAGGGAIASTAAVSTQSLGSGRTLHVTPPPVPAISLSFVDVNYLTGTVTIQGSNFTPGVTVQLSYDDDGPGSGTGIVGAPTNPGPACNPDLSSLLPCTTYPGYFIAQVPVVDCGPGDDFLVVAEDPASETTVTGEIATPC